MRKFLKITFILQISILNLLLTPRRISCTEVRSGRLIPSSYRNNPEGNFFYRDNMRIIGAYGNNTDLDNKHDDKQFAVVIENSLDLILRPAEFLILRNTFLLSGMLSPDYLYPASGQIEPIASGNLWSLNFPTLYFSVIFSGNDNSGASPGALRLDAGRHYFAEATAGSENFKNILVPEEINGMSMHFGNMWIGLVDILAMDILNLYQSPTLPSIFHQSGGSSPIIGEFNGDVLSFRSGIYYTTPDVRTLLQLNNLRLHFGFLFTRYGPVSGGIDRSGSFGNTLDNDYVLNYHASISHENRYFGMLLEFCRSDGIDRKAPDLGGYSMDVNSNGYFLRGGLFFFLSPGGEGKVIKQYIHFEALFSDGPVFNTYGEKTNYGFTAPFNFIGPELNSGNLWSFAPYAVSTNQGISNERSFGLNQNSGAFETMIAYGISLPEALHICFSATLIFDTARDENTAGVFDATEKFPDASSRYTGSETRLSMSYQINTYFRISAEAGVFFPGNIYKTIRPWPVDLQKDIFHGILLMVSAGF